MHGVGEDGQATFGTDLDAYGCCGQALTNFTRDPPAGPGRPRRHRRGSLLRIAPYHRTMDVRDHPESDPPPPFVTPAGEPTAASDGEERRSGFLLVAVRLIFIVTLVSVVMATVASARSTAEFGPSTVVGFIIAAAGLALVVLLLDALTPNKRLTSIVGIYLGICLGLVVALAIGSIIDIVARAWEVNSDTALLYVGLIKIVVGLVLCYFSVSFVLTTKDDFRLVIPYVEFSKQPRGVRPILLDTSTLVDGRIESIAGSRLLDASLIVPRFVLDELQQLADSADRQKRARGRRGLDVVARLQAEPYADVRIEDPSLERKPVDRMLVDYARAERLRIATTDSALQRVAEISGVPTINVHDFVAALRPSVGPGDPVDVEISRAGEHPGQGVGYLPDGTMVVMEGAAEMLGSTVHGIVVNSVQTAAGRMLFAKPEPARPGSAESMAEAATSQARLTERPARDRASPGARNPRRA